MVGALDEGMTKICEEHGIPTLSIEANSIKNRGAANLRFDAGHTIHLPCLVISPAWALTLQTLILMPFASKAFKAQEQVESITRSHIGVPCCPVAGIPLPEERELLQQTQEFSLT